jgi:tryptophan synthase alpha chain
VAAVADAVVIGARVIQAIEDAPAERKIDAAGEFVASIRAALDAKEVAR